MSWGTGACFGMTFWDKIREYIPEDKRKDLARELIGFLEDGDADFYDGNLYEDSGRGEEDRLKYDED